MEQVQKETYGRVLTGKKDVLRKYKLGKLKITDPMVLAKSEQKFHPIAIATNNNSDFIEGVIFEISENELAETDKYEVADYKRVMENFDSGNKAWVYVAAKQY